MKLINRRRPERDAGLREALTAYSNAYDFSRMMGDEAIIGMLAVLAAHPAPNTDGDAA